MKEFKKPTAVRRHMTARNAGVAAVAAMIWLTAAHGGSAGASPQASPNTASVADELPGYAVEDFNYPQADKILAERNIVLKRGDGHITLAECVTGAGLLEILARERTDKVCFQVTGNSGWLTLELPAVHAIRGNDYTTTVDMTVGTEEKTFDVAKNTWTSVGESADPERRDHTLVEIRVSK
ncbi:hypothetical protein ACFWFI_36565 [Streptomyces sp. NPDC060209]|uniref:hypothetical protein n=1 Tax=Streptomyces sp. NPDC060209 TaxID=3347073 RepID=UPI00366476C4